MTKKKKKVIVKFYYFLIFWADWKLNFNIKTFLIKTKKKRWIHMGTIKAKIIIPQSVKNNCIVTHTIECYFHSIKKALRRHGINYPNAKYIFLYFLRKEAGQKSNPTRIKKLGKRIQYFMTDTFISYIRILENYYSYPNFTQKYEQNRSNLTM